MKIPSTLPQAVLPLEKPVFASIFGSGMVVQCLKPLPVWGFAKPGTPVEVRLDAETLQTKADRNSRWKVVFQARQPSYQPMTLEVREGGKNAGSWTSLPGILAGEVWFCSGQSNMELGVGAASGGEQELKNADDPGLRLFLINKASSPIPLSSLDSCWKPATGQTVGEQGWGGFSAIAFRFGQVLRKALDCPVGLVQSAYGGARIHPFLNPRELKGRELAELKSEHHEAMLAWKQTLPAGAGEKSATSAVLTQETARTSHPFQYYDQYDTLKVSSVWNAMIHPLLPFSCRGVLWYQGESDTGHAKAYPARLAALRKGFARDLGTRELYLVQVAPWKYGQDSDLLDIWQAQDGFARKHHIPMAATVDVGNMDDIHPLVKKPVGERLARLALRHTYRQDIPGGSPRMQGLKKVDKGFLVQFDTGDSVLTLDPASIAGGCTQVKGFRLYGKDGSVQEVPGSLEGNRVRLCCEEAGKVKSISYAWTMYGEGNLANDLGEPAFPFIRDLV